MFIINTCTAAGVDQYGTPMVGNQAAPIEHGPAQPGMYIFNIHTVV